ncbi:MAG: methyltransferase [Rickettsiales bacterium]|nr:methyltransferase [Rickettsiales bacterium]
MVEAAALAQTEYLHSKPEVERKNLGQYFTGSAVADYMASLMKPTEVPLLRILDAGAGAGILTISAALHYLENGVKHVHAVLYEIDEDALAHLAINMEQVSEEFQARGGNFTFDIRHEDFILSRPDRTEAPFHMASINPPYFKYNTKTSPYAGVTADLFNGNPNIYASFMAVVSACLAPNGQMVAIVPRSFANGLYFKGFRNYLNHNMSLEKVHIFRSRDKVFKELSVLQENIICYYTKRPQISKIEVCTSNSHDDLRHAHPQTYPANLLIDTTNEHGIIRIPESSEDAQILKTVESWHSSFIDNGYFISTGPVVEHRSRQFITKPENTENSIPLLRMHNVKPFKTVWTGSAKKDVRFKLLDGHDKHTSDNQHYVILKRFSSKDEKRRLVAGIHDPQVIKGKFIALENHLNYIGHVDGDLNLAEAYGLAALLNSTFMDKYFRCISGNTQVNATEIRLLKLPARDVIHQIGLSFMKQIDVEQQHIDSIIHSHLNITQTVAA